MSIRIQDPEGTRHKIEIESETASGKAMAVLYIRDSTWGGWMESDRLILTGKSSGVVSLNPGEDSLTFLEDDEDDIVPEKEYVHHPEHYNSHPEGIEAILITQHENFLCGNVFKYLLRHGIKSEDLLQDIDKALVYLTKYREYVAKHGESALPAWRIAIRKKNRGEKD